MKFTRLMPALACAALLGACATVDGGAGSMSKPATMAAALSAADAAVAAGQQDKAFAVLANAAQAFPTDKTPWLRMAQMRYDRKNYGEAIMHAQHALERDPDDTLAHSIVAVSGLRVSSKALGDLTRKNRLSGNVKSEAEELTRLLRASLGEDVLVPRPKPPVRRPPLPTTASAAPAPAKAPSTSSDPFGAIK